MAILFLIFWGATIFSVVDLYLNFAVVENTPCVTWTSLNVWRLWLRPTVWPVWVTASRVLENHAYNVWQSVLEMSTRSSWLMVLFKSAASLLVSYLLLQLSSKGSWNVAMIADYSISPCCFISFCFLILKLCYYVHKCWGLYPLDESVPLLVLKWPLSLVVFFALKSIVSY